MTTRDAQIGSKRHFDPGAGTNPWTWNLPPNTTYTDPLYDGAQVRFVATSNSSRSVTFNAGTNNIFIPQYGLLQSTLDSSLDGSTVTLEWSATANYWYIPHNSIQAVGYGEMSLSTPAAGTSLGAGWDILDYFDTKTEGPYFAADTATGEFTVYTEGVWFYNVVISMDHNESNQGRSTQIRLWSVTNSQSLGAITIPIARNQPGSLITIPFVQYVTALDVLRLEMGGGDSVTAITYESLGISAIWQAPTGSTFGLPFQAAAAIMNVQDTTGANISDTAGDDILGT